ncbi:UDP-N-acetylmuramoyl-L-alanine--D-glutamate ligase [Martelella sp. HB161492]|uniref:UDP-N-acetylmuramoyl-L-alanine--D-glutamate ligase n=1 Tax=Martelella sp. HB161492 TaxID=2720726 RepID=UPI0015901438
MIPVTSFSGRKVALFGLGGSGLATAHALVAGGALVTAFDDKHEMVERARAEGIPVGDLRALDWSETGALVLSPGVPLTHPVPHWSVKLAQAAGVEIIGDVELFCRERRLHAPEATLIAITGTNGKSTTTALIAHILEEAGLDVQLGGNIGTAVLSLAEPAAGRFYVVECSSYQIDLAPSLDPDVGILLNVTPDHLDRHGDMAHYAAIKERLVAKSVVAVIAADDSYTRAIAARLDAAGHRVARVSKELGTVSEGLVFDGAAVLRIDHKAVFPVVDLSAQTALKGAHNGQNAAAAIAACLAAGLSDAEIVAGIASFPGLAHRMQPVARRGRVLFVNDSKATNADASAPALATFDRIYWILGGRPKQGGITSLGAFFPKVARAYLIGEAADAFAETLGDAVDHVMCDTLDKAVAAAAEDAAADPHDAPVVLLSPACASWDQFRSFEHRGEAFAAYVAEIEGVETLLRPKEGM